MNPWVIAGPSLGLYISGWLITGRGIYERMQHYPPGKPDYDDAMFALFGALIWPLLALFVAPVRFVTAKDRKRERRTAAKLHVRDLEDEIYGRRSLR